MTDEQTPAAGPLTAESVKLLKRNDWLHVRSAYSDAGGSIEPGAYRVRKLDKSGLPILDRPEEARDFSGWGESVWRGWDFLGRPDQSGWIAWHGGENPVPGIRVEVRLRDGSGLTSTEQGDHSSEQWDWPHYGAGGDIIAYRPHVPSPASSSSVVQGDAGGVEREFLDAEAMAEAWSDRVEIQRMVETTSAVFAKWASPELLSRFRQQMMGVIQQAYIEGVAARVLRPQPSGETR